MEIGPKDVIVNLCTVLIEKLRIFGFVLICLVLWLIDKFVSEGENITGSPFFSREPVEIYTKIFVKFYLTFMQGLTLFIIMFFNPLATNTVWGCLWIQMKGKKAGLFPTPIITEDESVSLENRFMIKIQN